MAFLRYIYHLISHIIHRNWYSIRRSYIWPESSYKRGLLKRVQVLYNIPSFVETGTFKGDTTRTLRRHFKKLWTIELDDGLFEAARLKLARYPNIVCLHGDSKEVLKQNVPELDSPTLFWLDGHYSGQGTAKGEIAAPLLEELSIIAQSSVRGHIIAIDDISDFCRKNGNTRLSAILQKLEEMNPQFKFYFDYDILFALPMEGVHREFWRKIAYPIVIR